MKSSLYFPHTLLILTHADTNTHANNHSHSHSQIHMYLHSSLLSSPLCLSSPLLSLLLCACPILSLECCDLCAGTGLSGPFLACTVCDGETLDRRFRTEYCVTQSITSVSTLSPLSLSPSPSSLPLSFSQSTTHPLSECRNQSS
jgi:hypothetical protein